MIERLPYSVLALQSHDRHLLQDPTVKSNADASLLSGAINPTTVRQGIFGFNGRNLLQDPTVKVVILQACPSVCCLPVSRCCLEQAQCHACLTAPAQSLNLSVVAEQRGRFPPERCHQPHNCPPGHLWLQRQKPAAEREGMHSPVKVQQSSHYQLCLSMSAKVKLLLILGAEWPSDRHFTLRCVSQRVVAGAGRCRCFHRSWIRQPNNSPSSHPGLQLWQEPAAGPHREGESSPGQQTGPIPSSLLLQQCMVQFPVLIVVHGNLLIHVPCYMSLIEQTLVSCRPTQMPQFSAATASTPQLSASPSWASTAGTCSRTPP